MGLDVFHDKLTLNPKSEENYYLIDDWEENCNVPLEVYAKYITDVKDSELRYVIAIMENEKDLEKLKKAGSFNNTEYFTKIFVRNLNEGIEKEIQDFIAKEKLDKLRSSRIRTEHDGLKYSEIFFD